jgi:hypothetical protein
VLIRRLEDLCPTHTHRTQDWDLFYQSISSLYVPRSILEQSFYSSKPFVVQGVKEDPSEVAYIRVESSTSESGDNH